MTAFLHLKNSNTIKLKVLITLLNRNIPTSHKKSKYNYGLKTEKTKTLPFYLSVVTFLQIRHERR